jgi:Mrp family chromosome partitioning ATPase/uncharacterized protein involved in exopolysaccharide biosynthesis
VEYRYYLDLLRRGKWTILASGILCLGLAFLSGFLRTPLYQAQATVSVELPPAPVDPTRAVMAPQYNSYFDYEYYFQTQLRVISSSTLALRAAEALARRPQYRGRKPEELAAELQASVAPRPVENTRIIAIAVTRESPEEAALWANAIAEAYVESNLEERKKSFQETIAALRALLERAEANQAQVVERLQQVVREFGVVPTEATGGKVDTSALEAATQNLLEAQRERQRAEARYHQALAAREAPHRIAALLSGPNELSGLLERKAALEREVQELARRGFLERNPRVVQLRAHLSAVDEQIARATEAALETLRNEVEAARQKEAEARRARDLERQRVHSASTDPRLLDQILQQAVVSEIARELKQTLNRVELSGQLLRNNVALVDRATPPRVPLNRQSPRVLLLGAFGGLLLGVGIVVLRDFVSTTIRDAEEIERLLERPVLGEIPRSTAVEEFAWREAFHGLWTNLKLFHRGPSSHVVLVTSAVMEEGKTTVACELAQTAARLGARTILVDVDLRRPDVHRRFSRLRRRGPQLGAVLVVDDETAVRHLIAGGLATFQREGLAGGWTLGPILMAEDAEEALAKIRANDVALAIVDVKLPGMSGTELLERIKELSPRTEVVVITGHASLETAIEAVRRGAADYLTKPFGLDALREALERAVRRRMPEAPADGRVSSSEGVVAYLAGEAELSALVCETDIPNLSVLPAGHPPPNPFLLLDRAALHELVRELKAQFEWVVIDSPPVAAVSDPLVLAPVVDGILVVVRFDRTDRRVVRRAVQRLARANAPIWGVVVNDIRSEEGPYEQYSYAYRPREEAESRRSFWDRGREAMGIVRRREQQRSEG